MSDTESKRPAAHVASVEDWDDDAEAPLPGTRTVANSAVRRSPSTSPDRTSVPILYKHNDNDSGYGSKSPTVSSMTSKNGREADPLEASLLLERERQPYSRTARIEEKPVVAKVKSNTSGSTPRKFCHKQGECWVCDKYGHHFDPATLSKSETKPVPPLRQPSPPNTRAVVKTVQTENTSRPALARRTSSNRTVRPMSMYAALPVQPVQPVYTQYATPPPQHIQPPASYATYFNTPHVAYTGYTAQQAIYFEPPSVFDQPAAPRTRRLSSVSHERPTLTKPESSTQPLLDRPSAMDKRPALDLHRYSKSKDLDRFIMPPPPRPLAANVATRLPTTKPAIHHTTNVDTSYQRRYDVVESSEDESGDEARYSISHRQNTAALSRPPSSYRRPTSDLPERPAIQQKSRSYTNGTQQTQTVNSSREHVMPRRRTADSAQLAQREAEIEAYMRKHGVASSDLTVENLKRASRPFDARSDTGSTTSQHTQYSSSKGSGAGSHPRGRNLESRSTNMNISINGMNLQIANDLDGYSTPLTIDLGGVQISMGQNKENNVPYPQNQKQIERAPSASSTRRSRHSVTGNGANVSREQYAIEAARETSRRNSIDEHEMVRQSSKRSSRQASRNTSTTRHDDGARTSNRNSVDYAIIE